MAQQANDPVLLQPWLRLYATAVAKKNRKKSSGRGTAETNPTRNREVAESIPGLAQWVQGPALL